jgi:hypothetical protein
MMFKVSWKLYTDDGDEYGEDAGNEEEGRVHVLLVTCSFVNLQGC